MSDQSSMEFELPRRNMISAAALKLAACLSRVLGIAIVILVLLLPAISFAPDQTVLAAEKSADPKRQGKVSPPRSAPNSKSAAKRDGKSENLVGHGGPVRGISLDPLTKRALTGSFDYTMILWDLSQKPARLVQRFRDHGGPVNITAFLKTRNHALSGSDDGSVRLFDLGTNNLLHQFKGHSSKVVQISIDSSEKYAVSASWDRTARIWNLATLKPGPVLAGHKGPINTVAFIPKTHEVVTGSYDGTIRLWNAENGELIREVHRHGWGINVLQVIDEKPKRGEKRGQGRKILFGTQNGDVQILDLETGKTVKLLNPHEGPVLSLAISDRHKLVATGGGDGKIRVWNGADWSLLEEYQIPQGPVWSMAFSPDAEGLYFTGLDDFAIYWKINPRAGFEPVQSHFPRRFQVRDNMSVGERQFARKCSVCHSLSPGDGNRAGPTLYGIFGRKAGSLPGYLYSEGLKRSKIIWSETTIALLF